MEFVPFVILAFAFVILAFAGMTGAI